MRRIIPRRLRHGSSGAEKPTTTSATLEVSEEDADVQLSSYGFKVWYDPGSVPEPKPHLFDIIFVHGLTGDRERTWTHPESQEPWPKTLIPKEFPGARVLTYGYDAYVILKKGPVSSNRLNNHSLDFLNALITLRQREKSKGRPLIFIAHSLGGIVCKDALLLSCKSDETIGQTIFTDTLGLIFMGTPHTGASLAWWAKVPAIALGVVKSTNKNLLDILETSNETITRIQNDFLQKIQSKMNTTHEIHIVCFYETLPMHHFQQIVSADSAILPGFNHISVHADHKNMVKFRSEDKDMGCAQFFGILRRWAPRAAEKVALVGLSIDRIERYQKQCLESLAFSEMIFRRSTISDPIQDTCDWIFRDEVYQMWTAEPDVRPKDPKVDRSAVRDEGVSDLLCLAGKPGSGKSTIMKNLYTVHEKRQVDLGSICVAFFFNARGSPLEKSPEGFYRSLLFQLLRSNLKVFQMILPVLREKEAIGASGLFKWHQSEITEQLHRILRDERVHNVTIFIDGIDECEDNDAGREIVTSLERSLEVSRKFATNLRICISSRPYRQIKPKFGLVLQVETRNASDIELYIDRELVLHGFGDLAELKTKMIKKASGVFLWITLVVKKLRTAWDRGCSPVQIRQILESLPVELRDLYLYVSSSMTEEQLQTSSQIAQLVLYSRYSMSANDMHSILALASSSSGVSLLGIAKSSPINAHDLARFAAYITENTGGFFEISANDHKHVVQVIHETIRDFLKSSEAQKLYGRTSPPFRKQETEKIVLSAMHNYAASNEVRASFAPTEGKISQAKRWTRFCERSPPQHLYPLSEAVPMYLVTHGLDYLDDYLNIAFHQSHGAQKASELRSLLEGWFFACMVMSLNAPSEKDADADPFDDDYRKRSIPTFVELAKSFLSYLLEHERVLGLDKVEFEQLAICMNNRSAFLETIRYMREQPEIIQQHSSHFFHLVCWAMDEEGSSVVGEVKVLDRRRRLTVEERPPVMPHDVIKLCRKNSKGLAFTASFAWRLDRTGLKTVLDTWLVHETLDEFMQIAVSEFRDKEEDLIERMPLHLNKEDGYIALILTQGSGAVAENQGRSKRLQVFAVLEKDDPSTPWKETAVGQNSENPIVMPPMLRLRRKGSINSMRTNAPDRGIGLSIWYAWNTTANRQKADKDDHDKPCHMRATRHPQDGVFPELSTENVKKLSNSFSMDDDPKPFFEQPWTVEWLTAYDDDDNDVLRDAHRVIERFDETWRH